MLWRMATYTRPAHTKREYNATLAEVTGHASTGCAWRVPVFRTDYPPRKQMQNENDGRNRSLWRFFDGAASVSVSMALSVALSGCAFCGRLPPLGFLNELTKREDGVIITATLLLFPTTAVLYGGFKLFFAAKEAVERKARERGQTEGREQGRQEGRQEERERINRILEEFSVSLPPEVAKKLSGDDE